MAACVIQFFTVNLGKCHSAIASFYCFILCKLPYYKVILEELPKQKQCVVCQRLTLSHTLGLELIFFLPLSFVCMRILISTVALKVREEENISMISLCKKNQGYYFKTCLKYTGVLFLLILIKSYIQQYLLT